MAVASSAWVPAPAWRSAVSRVRKACSAMGVKSGEAVGGPRPWHRRSAIKCGVRGRLGTPGRMDEPSRPARVRRPGLPLLVHGDLPTPAVRATSTQQLLFVEWGQHPQLIVTRLCRKAKTRALRRESTPSLCSRLTMCVRTVSVLTWSC
jgi:hypothetical protein